MLTYIIIAAVGVAAGLLIGINNPTLAASVKKALVSDASKLDAALATVRAKLGK
ncbi:MAG TPA: hypothetical protein VGF89_00890 [Steroidobacteraceae bacterium]|jgi:hypothetical protein